MTSPRPVFFLLGALCFTNVVNGAELLPFGFSNSDKNQTIGDDKNVEISLTRPLLFFSKAYEKIYVSDNGLIFFDKSIHGQSLHKPKVFSTFDKQLIAPLWFDFYGASLFYRQTTARSDLDKASYHVITTHPEYNNSFQAEWALIVTWFNVTAYGDQLKRTHTFQAVLVADNTSAFAIYIYGDVNNARKAQVGVNAGECSESYYTLCISGTEETNNLENLRSCDGEIGVLGFRIDEPDQDQFIYICTPTDTTYPASQCECPPFSLPESEVAYVFDNQTKVGSVLMYVCAEDYVMTEEDEVACIFNGTHAVWDGFKHSCRKRPTWVVPPKGEYGMKNIPENQEDASVIYELQATSGDVTLNVTYELIQITPQVPLTFLLDDNQVMLLPGADLDVDFNDAYTTYILHFRATDELYDIGAESFVIFTITDVNDNSPQFDDINYYKAIEGDEAIGTTVLKISAFDKDRTYPNNRVQYRFLEENHPGYFSIETLDGAVKLIKRPTYTKYQMTVQAYDGGSPPRATTTFLRILVKSEGTPTSKPDGQVQPSVQKSSSDGTAIGIVIAVIVLVLIAVVLAFLYRRRRQQGLTGFPNLTAVFDKIKADAHISLDNPNFVSNPTAVIASEGRDESRNSTNELQPDTHYDTDVLTSDSWRKEKQKNKQ